MPEFSFVRMKYEHAVTRATIEDDANLPAPVQPEGDGDWRLVDVTLLMTGGRGGVVWWWEREVGPVEMTPLSRGRFRVNDMNDIDPGFAVPVGGPRISAKGTYTATAQSEAFAREKADIKALLTEKWNRVKAIVDGEAYVPSREELRDAQDARGNREEDGATILLH